MLVETAAPLTPRIRISQGGVGPSPPLAGALAAWVLRAGGDVVVVDPRGAPRGIGWDALSGEPVDAAAVARWPLWAHLEGGFQDDRLAQVALLAGGAELVLFGPGADEERLLVGTAPEGPERVRIVRGDPEEGLGRDLSLLPLTTFAGFGSAGGAFRLLAGRGDRVKPVSLVVREIVYLVESAQLGHVLFDDADLAAYGDWVDRFEDELRHLPWPITWEGTWQGARTGVRGG